MAVMSLAGLSITQLILKEHRGIRMNNRQGQYLLLSLCVEASSLRGLTVRGGRLRPAGAMLAALRLRCAPRVPAPQRMTSPHVTSPNTNMIGLYLDQSLW